MIKFAKLIGCLVVIVWFTLIFVISFDPSAPGPWVIKWGSLAVALVFGLIALRVIFSPMTVDAPSIEELEAKGLIETEEYTVSRAIMVEEFDDEGLYYLLK